MAICANCGKKIGAFKGIKIEGRSVCKECEPILRKKIQKRKEILERGVHDILAVTSPILEGYKIKKYYGFISAQAVMGVGAFNDLLASFRDMWGGRAGALQNEIKNAEGIALQELKVEAVLYGANGVIDTSMDYEIIDTGGGKMLMVVATGTAVEMEER